MSQSTNSKTNMQSRQTTIVQSHQPAHACSIERAVTILCNDPACNTVTLTCDAGDICVKSIENLAGTTMSTTVHNFKWVGFAMLDCDQDQDCIDTRLVERGDPITIGYKDATSAEHAIFHQAPLGNVHDEPATRFEDTAEYKRAKECVWNDAEEFCPHVNSVFYLAYNTMFRGHPHKRFKQDPYGKNCIDAENLREIMDDESSTHEAFVHGGNLILGRTQNKAVDTTISFHFLVMDTASSPCITCTFSYDENLSLSAPDEDMEK